MKSKRILSLVLSLVIMLSAATVSAFAENESINVTVKFDASVVAADMDTLYSDLKASDIIGEETTDIPDDITVTVPKGSTVKEVLEAAQEKAGFTAVGIDSNFVTQVGYVGKDILENLVSISVGDYYSENIFYCAGWSFYIDGAGLTAGIDSVEVTEAGAVIEGRFGLATGYDSDWNMLHYDEIFLDNYAELKGLTEADVDTSTFSEAQLQMLTAKKAEAEALLAEIYNEAALNEDISATLLEAHTGFKTSGGMWIGYIEKKGTSFWGTGSPSEKLEIAAKELEAAMHPLSEDLNPEIPDLEEENPDLENVPLEKEVRDKLISSLLENIAKSYTDKSSYWEVMDMGAYKKYASETESVLADDVSRSFINTAIKTVAENNTDTELAKAILALTAQGKDATRLYKVNNNTPMDAVQKLSGTEHSTSVWSAPYTLAAYNRDEYENREKELSLVNALLTSQGKNGAWDEYGTIDTTANAIAGLSFYLNDEDVGVKTNVTKAIEAALTYLSEQQNEDGSFSDSWSGRNSNSTAMVAIALAAAGVDVENDERFIKNGNCIIDGLLSFALEDNSGFGHTDNVAASDKSTEQAFRALIAIAGAIKTDAAYNVYDFNGIMLSPARATDEYTGGNTPFEPQGNQISVSLTIKVDNGNWLSSYNVTLPGDGATVYHAFVKGCNANNLKYEGADNGYVSSISKGNKTLAEFGMGENSGWLYKLNGEAPLLGIRECEVKNGDSILFFYTQDYTKEPGIGGGLAASGSEEKAEQKPEEEEEPVTQPSKTDFDDVSDNAWYKSAVEFAVENKLFNGVSEKEFAPSASMTRAMLVTVLYRLEKADGPEKVNSFADIPAGMWYSTPVAWAANSGIVTGVSESRFAPDAGITREQMAAILYRYASLKGYVKQNGFALSEFADSDNISTWAYDALCWANTEQLINGRENGFLAPQEGATRAEVAAILMRFCEKYIK